MGLRAGLDWCGKSRLHRVSIPGPSSPATLYRYINKTMNTENYMTDSLIVCIPDELEVLLGSLKEYGLVTRCMQGRDDRCNENLIGIPHRDRREAVCEGGDGMHLATEFDEWLRFLQ